MTSWRQHYQRARAASELKRWDMAHEQILLALADAPDEWLLHVSRAEICYRLERFEEARSAANEAVANDPDAALGYFWLAWSLITDVNAGPHRLSEAISLADRALECSPDDADILHLRAAAARLAGQTHDAESFARAGLQSDPEHVGCLDALARIQAGWNLDHDAETTLRQMLRLAPESRSADEQMAQLALRGQRFAEAYEHASTAVRQDPNAPDLRELYTEAVRHQHPLARFFLWSAKPWDRYVVFLVPIGLAPLLALKLLPPDTSDWLEATLAALAFFFCLAWAFYGAIAVFAAETIIAHSSRFSSLVPETRAMRPIFAFAWIATLAVILATLTGAFLVTSQPFLIVGNLVMCGIVVFIARSAASKSQTIATLAVTIIPIAYQSLALCWPSELRTPVYVLAVPCWALTILAALMLSGRAR